MAGPVSGRGGAGERRLFVLASPEELARAAAGRLWAIVRERTAAGSTGKGPGRSAVALSGGSTPRLFLEALVSPPYRERFPWTEIDFFQVDERWVPADDPRSNQRMLRERLVDGGPVPERNFHPVDTSLPDPGTAAKRYEALLRSALPAPRGGVPRLDAIFLGIGSDGHTASLFPGSPALAERTALVARADGGSPPIPRVTLTLPVINAARRVIFLVSGAEKAEALRRLVQETGASGLPAALVSPGRGQATILADSAAAARIPEKDLPRQEAGIEGGRR